MKNCETCFKKTFTHYCDEKQSAMFGIHVPKEIGCIYHEEKPKEREVTVEEAISEIAIARDIWSQTEITQRSCDLAIRALEEMKEREEKKSKPTSYSPRNFSEISELRRGDIVRGKVSGNSYVITTNHGNSAIAVNTVQITNPNEWEVFRKDESK